MHNTSAMRKLYLSLILPLLMLLSQQGAVWHEIGHSGSGSSPVQSDKKQPTDKLCETCLAFAHLAATAKPEIPQPPSVNVSHTLVAVDAVPFVAADAPSQRSRGPPTFL